MRLVTRDFSGCWGIDLSAKPTLADIPRIVATPLPNGQRIQFVIRPVFFGPPRPGDIDAAELQGWLAAKVGVALYLHPRFPKDNTLSHQTGIDDVGWFIRNALAIGYNPSKIEPAAGPPPMSPDLEGVQNPPSSPYAAACTTTLRAQAFGPLLYLGFACGLTSADCDAMPGDPLWWCDFAPYADRPAPKKGYAVKQGTQITHCGYAVDPDQALAGGGFCAVVDEDVLEDPKPHENPVDQKDTDPPEGPDTEPGT